ncbi:MAG: LysR family transcriptional regulator ArgP [Desulfovibrio sp.]|uniref:LysR family transcriptional regulator ArgP n=1 Tax=Desulfovibrio sp. 7SRBS1 TaxID=3378064 RepID=UPI003B3ED4EB
MLDYKGIEALAAVVREGGFEKAAASLYITQSAVSQRIRAIEERAGRLLLNRTNPPRPTSAGRLVLRHQAQVALLENDLQAALFPEAEEGFASLPVGVNADSLAIWFHQAMGSFVARERMLLDLYVDDQDQTHKLLRKGEVLGCVSSLAEETRGCRTVRLGSMTYRLVASPEYVAKYLPDFGTDFWTGGPTLEAMSKAPLLCFNRRDKVHEPLFDIMYNGKQPDSPCHYVPSIEGHVGLVLAGAGYGMVPDQHSQPHLRSGRLIDLAPEHAQCIGLYWHCWNLESDLLKRFTNELEERAAGLLDQ